MSAHKIQMPGNYPEKSIQHSEQGKSLKSQIRNITRCVETVCKMLAPTTTSNNEMEQVVS
jgi:hypothetical protein